MSQNHDISYSLNNNSRVQLMGSAEDLGAVSVQQNMQVSGSKSKSNSNQQKVSKKRRDQDGSSNGSKHLPYMNSNQTAVEASIGLPVQNQRYEQAGSHQRQSLQNKSTKPVGAIHTLNMVNQLDSSKPLKELNAKEAALLKNISRELQNHEDISAAQHPPRSIAQVGLSLNQLDQNSMSEDAADASQDQERSLLGKLANRNSGERQNAVVPHNMSVSFQHDQSCNRKEPMRINRALNSDLDSAPVKSEINHPSGGDKKSGYLPLINTRGNKILCQDSQRESQDARPLMNSSMFQTSGQEKKTFQESKELSGTIILDKKDAVDEEDLDLTEFQKARRNCSKRWAKFIFKPKDKFKIKWDIFVIILSIWNAIQIPLAFAFPGAFKDKIGYEYSDYVIDFCFIFDIVINFRSCYMDPRTDVLVEDPNKITRNYMSGRFWVDLVASCNFDLIFAVLLPNMQESALTSIFGMLKLVRLLRLGRMVTYLSKSKEAKFGAKMIELIFMLLLLLHWMACGWYILSSQESKWIPSKDLDWSETIVFSAALENTDLGYFQSYAILFYYACLALLGNDYVPTNSLENLLACLLVLTGVTSVGYIIGQFAQLLSDSDMKKRKKAELFERLSAKMTNLQVPEEIYTRITDFYEEKQKIPFVSDRAIYKNFNKSIKVQLCKEQMREPIKCFTKKFSLKLAAITKTQIEIGHSRLINKLSVIAQTAFFLPDQTVIRQDALPDGFYFIIKGDCVVYQESEGDFKDYDYFEEKMILANPEGDDDDMQSEMNSLNKSPSMVSFDDQYSGSPSNVKRFRHDSSMSKASIQFDVRQVEAPESGTLSKDASATSLRYTPGNYAKQDEELAKLDFISPQKRRSSVRVVKVEEEKTRFQKIKEFMRTNEPVAKIEDEDIQRNIKLRRINHLEKGDIFGEISLITKLRRTASIFTHSKVTCGYVPKKKFRSLLQDNHEFKDSINRYLHGYKDRICKFLTIVIKNVPAFRTVSEKSAKDISFALRNLTAPANECILRKGEISKKCFFIKEGAIDVMVRQHDESQPPYLMARLSRGACFNFTNSFMERPSLFDFVVSSSNNQELNNGTTLLYVLEKDDFDALVKHNEELLNARTSVFTRATEDIIKYDYDRMVYANLGQLSRAQKMKKCYLENQQVELDSKPTGGASVVMKLLQRENAGNKDEQDSVFKVSGSASAVQHFKKSIIKFKNSIMQFRVDNFYIRDMQIFQLVDESFDKFSGYALNVDLAVMLYSGEHLAAHKQMVQYYLMKNQGKIEREAAKRTIMSGLDHLTMAQQGYMARQMNDQHFNEEGEVVFQGDYSHDQTALRQMQLFKLQQEKLNNLLEACQTNYLLVDSIKQQFIRSFTTKQKKIDQLKRNLDMTLKSSQLHNNPASMDKNIGDLIESARHAGVDVDDTMGSNLYSMEQSLFQNKNDKQPYEAGNDYMFLQDEHRPKQKNTGKPSPDEYTQVLSDADLTLPTQNFKVSSPDQRKILMELAVHQVTPIAKNDYRSQTHHRIGSEQTVTPSMHGDQDILKRNSKETETTMKHLAISGNLKAQTQVLGGHQRQGQRIHDKGQTQTFGALKPLQRNIETYQIPGQNQKPTNSVSGGILDEFGHGTVADYAPHSNQNFQKTALQVGNLLMSDHDSSEIAEKLQVLDKMKLHGRNASVTSNERDSVSQYNYSQVSQPGQQQKSNDRIGSKTSGSNSNPFIKAGAMSFERNIKR